MGLLPFITMQLARVTRRDFDGEINVVTTVDRQHQIQYECNGTWCKADVQYPAGNDGSCPW